jgi:hypothetical protein
MSVLAGDKIATVTDIRSTDYATRCAPIEQTPIAKKLIFTNSLWKFSLVGKFKIGKYLFTTFAFMPIKIGIMPTTRAVASYIARVLVSHDRSIISSGAGWGCLNNSISRPCNYIGERIEGYCLGSLPTNSRASCISRIIANISAVMGFLRYCVRPRTHTSIPIHNDYITQINQNSLYVGCTLVAH